MALTPHSKDPKRKEQLAEIKEGNYLGNNPKAERVMEKQPATKETGKKDK